MYFTTKDAWDIAIKESKQNKMLHLKRKWLIGSSSEMDSLPQKKLKRLSLQLEEEEGSHLRETLLRDDDLSCENVRNCIEIGFNLLLGRWVSIHGPPLMSPVDTSFYILDRLDSLSIRALASMHRRLRGVKSVPALNKRIGWNKDRLVAVIRQACKRMLSQIQQGQPLPDRLSKAMAIATLSFQIEQTTELSMQDLFVCSPDVKTSRDQILDAIRILPHITCIELGELKDILDPNLRTPFSNFRKSVKNLLTDCFFECGSVRFSDSVIKAIDFVSMRSSHLPSLHDLPEKIDEEVESVLTISAHLKQYVWDTFLGDDYDEAFADAYMDEPSREEGCWDKIHSGTSFHAVIPDAVDNEGNVCDSCSAEYFSLSADDHNGEHCSEQKIVHEYGFKESNKYVAVQDICDGVSLIAHNLVGSLIQGFSECEGIPLNEAQRSYLTGTLYPNVEIYLEKLRNMLVRDRVQ